MQRYVPLSVVTADPERPSSLAFAKQKIDRLRQKPTSSSGGWRIGAGEEKDEQAVAG